VHAGRSIIVTQTIDGFDAFYAEQRDRAVELAWVLTHDRSLCEDVAQDAFAAVYARFDGLADPVRYLRRAVVNGVYDRSRRTSRERRRLRLVSSGETAVVAGPTGGVADIVAALPLKQRTAVVLRFWGGLTDGEIAEVMSMRPSSVRSLLSRAMARLRLEISA